MGEITRLDDHRPHVLVVGSNGVRHITPLRLLEYLADNKVKIEEVNDGEFELMCAVIHDWLERAE